MNTVDLSWSGATKAVDIFRNNVQIVTSGPNDGAHTDSAGKGAATYNYKVCETGSTSVCSAVKTIVF